MTTVDPVDQAKSIIASHEDLAKAGDLDGITANFADDIVVLATDMPLVEGKAAVREMYAGLLHMGSWDFVHDYSGVEVVADLVILHGVARGSLIPESGEPDEFANNFLIIMKRQADGHYRFWRVAFAPSGA
jgi:ketosteroid isomerase-like protein